jgi:Leucine-rich repeat (LRR) protein
MKKLTQNELLWLEDQARENEFFKSLLIHYKLKAFLTPDQYYWLNLFIGDSRSNIATTSVSRGTHTITKIPYPHCNFLCSSQIKYCSKCGEPLPELETMLRAQEFSISEIVDEDYIEKNIIHSLEKRVNKTISCKEDFEVSTRCYVKQENRIIAVNLYKSGLTTFPQELLKLPSLKYLALRRNSITKLVKHIGFLSNLEYLDVRINKLQRLPRSIGLLTNLKVLNLSSNQLIELPESIGNLESLKELNLKNNKLKTIPPSILLLGNLEKLNLKGNFWITNQTTIHQLQQKGIEVI